MAIDVKGLVAEKLVEWAPSVSESVIDTLAKREHDRRVSAFLYVVEEIEKARKELYKVKPDIVSYNVDRSIASESYSKETLDKKQKLEETMNKLIAAVEKTEVEPRDFSKVIEIYEKANGGK
jgi:GTPase involved in cell partitioning and DNA repair